VRPVIGGLGLNAVFHNTGLLRKSASTNTTSIFSASLDNTGTVLAQSGTLAFYSGASLAGGTLGVWLNGSQNYGRFQFAGATTLDGGFFAVLNNGFVPAVSNSFTVVSYGSRSDAFTSVTLPSAATWTSNCGPSAFTLTATEIHAPVIVAHPQSQAVPLGANVVLAASATSATPMTLQWRRNGASLAGETNATLSLAGVQAADDGTYDLEATNPFGTARSNPVRLVVHTCGGLPGGAVAFWPADGHPLDLAGGRHGVLRNGASYGTGVSEEAFRLPGGGAHVEVADNPLLNLTNALTVMAWIYREANAGTYDPIIKKANGGGYALEFNTGHDLLWWVHTSAGWQSSQSMPVSLESWTHVAGTLDGTNLVLYVNGRPSVPVTITGPMTPSSASLNIGRDPVNTWRQFIGLIDEAALFNRALSSNEIAAIYASGICTSNLAGTPPMIVVQPADRTNALGTLATFTVQASGSPPPSYQWRFNGMSLADGGRVSGAHASTLAITGVQLSDAGGYSVAVSNAAGSTNSVAAQLVVDAVPPVISGVVATSGLTTCSIVWVTAEPATRVVEYGLDANYGFTNRILSPLDTNHSVTLTGLTPDTVHHFRVRSADAVGNESASADGTFTTLPALDLRVVEFVVNGPPILQSGDTVELRWVTTNAGRAEVVRDFSDHVDVRNLTTGAGLLSAAPRFFSPFPPGATRTNTYLVFVHDGIDGAGEIDFSVRLDLYNEVVEFFLGLNAETNNSATVVVSSALRPYPDLTITNLTAPSNAVPGQPVELVWTLANEGDAPPSRPWLMRTYLSTDSVLGGDTLLASVDGPTNIGPGVAAVDSSGDNPSVRQRRPLAAGGGRLGQRAL
jgi:hypothetical protein